MSVLSNAPKPSSDAVRRVALAALAAALDGDTQQQQRAPKRKGGLRSGVRTVAAGAALYVVGRTAYKNRDAILDQIQDGRDAEAEEDEEFEEDEEPVAEEDEDFDDDLDPVDRPPEPPESEEDEERADADAEPVGR